MSCLVWTSELKCKFYCGRLIYVPICIIISSNVEQVLLSLLFSILISYFTVTAVPSSEAWSCWSCLMRLLWKCVISSAFMTQQWLEAPSLPDAYEYFGLLKVFSSNLDSSLWSTLSAPWKVLKKDSALSHIQVVMGNWVNFQLWKYNNIYIYIFNNYTLKFIDFSFSFHVYVFAASWHEMLKDVPHELQCHAHWFM